MKQVKKGDKFIYTHDAPYGPESNTIYTGDEVIVAMDAYITSTYDLLYTVSGHALFHWRVTPFKKYHFEKQLSEIIKK